MPFFFKELDQETVIFRQKEWMSSVRCVQGGVGIPGKKNVRVSLY